MRLAIQLAGNCTCKLYSITGYPYKKCAKSTLQFSKRGISYVSNAIVRKPPWRVLFFGTDDFSLPCLKMLLKELQEGQFVKRLAVVTSLKAKKNPVRDFALMTELPTFGWPFHAFPGNFDVGLISSFGHLIPEHILVSLPLGMLNVHASLLPRWRGAAPIIYAILNGDSETGVTIMQVKAKKFDIGDIISQERCPILPSDTAPTLKTRLADLGSELLLDALKDLPLCLNKSVPQPDFGITYGVEFLHMLAAPRVNSSLAKVDWQNMEAINVYNLHRALTGLYTLTTKWHGLPIKLLEPSLKFEICDQEKRTSNSWLLNTPGCLELDPTGNFVRVLCADNQWIGFRAITVPGKKPMSPQDFYNGYISKRSVVEWIFT